MIARKEEAEKAEMKCTFSVNHLINKSMKHFSCHILQALNASSMQQSFVNLSDNCTDVKTTI